MLAIETHARRGDDPYGAWRSEADGALPGSFVVIGGLGTHLGMLVQSLGGGRAKTVEATHPPGRRLAGNGGRIAARVRSAAEITGVATMSYPTDR